MLHSPQQLHLFRCSRLIGFYRLLLALLVLGQHIGQFLPFSASLAVFSFYTLSGYLITLAVKRSYLGEHGRLRFVLNRALRIYPTYLACLLISILVVLYLGDGAQVFRTMLRLPATTADWLSNLTLVGFLTPDMFSLPRLLPTAWSLNVELLYYGIIGLAAGRSGRVALAWLAISLVIMAEGVLNLDSRSFYFTFMYPSFCFAAGSCFAHYGKTHSKWFAIPALVYLFSPALLGLAGIGTDETIAKALLVGTPVAAIGVIGALSTIRPASKAVHFLERWAGDITYPIFLIQWPVATLLNVEIGLQRGWSLALGTALASVLVSIGIVLIVERPIAMARNWVRSDQSQRRTPVSVQQAATTV